MMNRYSLLLLGLFGGNAIAAEVFVTPYAGYSFGGQGLAVNGVDDYRSGKAEDSSHLGVMLGFTLSPLSDSYFLYSHQQTDLLQQVDGREQRFDALSVDYWHAGGTLYFSRDNLQPYVTGSFGLTRLQPEQSLDASSYFSMSLGVGAQLFLTDNLALLTEVRGFATFVGNDKRFDCYQNQQCTWYYSGDTVWQGRPI
ncbi:outer membrane beta-barrel protein [Shewanella dokdonensis]|uniref:Outer membrane beta-barrel protein n=1 Tax=Shewanella dokdonensis TaxID=712036 RepID=A0ABX8DHT5_9GAMM|nr:outer membrane beta-barrel protein [Shewanella dokdonensis]QVK23945.1 outer membrane beta-barrel protein [Shewanella dokdonensis]